MSQPARRGRRLPPLRFLLFAVALIALLHAWVGWRLIPDAALGSAGTALAVLALVASAILVPAGLLARALGTGRRADVVAWIGLTVAGLFSSLLVLTFLRELALLLALWALPGPDFAALAKVSAGGTAARDALAQAYTEIFCALGEPRVMLYGSWYISGALMDVPLARLRADLAQLGFERQPGITEPEDHVAALCEVMAELIAGGSHAQAGFFQRHLAPWYGRLCMALAAEENGFYRSAAAFTRNYLDGEHELLAP